LALRSQPTTLIPIGLILSLAAGGGFLITQTSPGLSLGITLLLALLFVSFLNSEFALHIILISMLLSPEIVVGGVGGISIGKPEIKGDLLVLRIEDLILTVVIVAWFARAAIWKELRLIKRTNLNLPIFTYSGIIVIATLLGVLFGNVQPVRGFFFSLKYIEFFVVYFITVNCIQNEDQLRRLLITMFATCAISAIIGIAQIPSGERVAAPFEGKFGEPNTFGGYLVLMLALVLSMALTKPSGKSRIGWTTFAFLIFVPLLFTLSRTSWLAAVPMLFTLVYFSPRRLVLIAALALSLAFGATILPQPVINRFNYTFRSQVDRGQVALAGARLDTSTSARIESWDMGYQSWLKQPFLGYGARGFGFIDAQYVRVLVETGLFGLAAFIWLLWRILEEARRTYHRCRGTRYEGFALGYFAGFIAMVTHCIGANTFIIVRIMEPFWFLTGIVAVVPVLLAKPDSFPLEGSPDPASQPQSTSRVKAAGGSAALRPGVGDGHHSSSASVRAKPRDLL
jgi:O-antigen ligase